jgi:hypothetical protein
MGRFYAVVFVLILLVVVYFFSSIGTYAVVQTNIPTPTLSDETQAFTITNVNINSEQKVSSESVAGYALPYPGILPDHPLYPLKKVRDLLLEFLIRDPLKKTEYYILMSDKLMNMGLSLIDKGNYDLAYETMLTAQDYFDKALQTVPIAKQAGRTIDAGILDRLKQSNKKHETIVVVVIEKSPEKSTKLSEELLPRIRKLQEQLATLEV